MNSNSKLKIVWMVCGVAIVLLFCTQAYWLHLQCQYSLDQQVEQFKKDCDEVLAQDLKIISRARPMDKKRLVEALQRKNQVVAVTGDGTNDVFYYPLVNI